MARMQIGEPARRTPVVAETDVLVAGAGPAGLAAAIGAARTGAKTLLVEKHGFLGGMLTAGSVLNIRQFNDGKRVIIGGVAGELARRIKNAGGTQHTPAEGSCVRHDPEVTKVAAQEMALEAGVQLLLHTWVAGAVVRDGVTEGLLIENKSGRGALLGRVTVDATGDGDVIWQAGAEFEKSDGRLQPMTLTFVLGGVELWPQTMTAETRSAIKKAVDEGTFPAPRPPALFPMWRRAEVYANATRIAGDCTVASDLTNAEVEGRRQVMGILEWLRRNAEGYRNAYLIATGAQVGLRESRRLAGVYTLTREDVLQGRDFPDGIARGAYGIDIHYPGRGAEMVLLEPGRSYGIPWRCLVPRRLDGLIAAGRCISATHEALGSTRVMATCMAIGHAAGVGAALSALRRTRARDLAVEDIRHALKVQGAVL